MNTLSLENAQVLAHKVGSLMETMEITYPFLNMACEHLLSTNTTNPPNVPKPVDENIRKNVERCVLDFLLEEDGCSYDLKVAAIEGEMGYVQVVLKQYAHTRELNQQKQVVKDGDLFMAYLLQPQAFLSSVQERLMQMEQALSDALGEGRTVVPTVRTEHNYQNPKAKGVLMFDPSSSEKTIKQFLLAVADGRMADIRELSEMIFWEEMYEVRDGLIFTLIISTNRNLGELSEAENNKETNFICEVLQLCMLKGYNPLLDHDIDDVLVYSEKILPYLSTMCEQMNIRDHDGNTLAHLIAKFLMVKPSLFSQQPKDLMQQNQFGQTPLHLIVGSDLEVYDGNDQERVDQLLETFVLFDRKCDLWQVRDKNMKTPLILLQENVKRFLYQDDYGFLKLSEFAREKESLILKKELVGELTELSRKSTTRSKKML